MFVTISFIYTLMFVEHMLLSQYYHATIVGSRP